MTPLGGVEGATLLPRRAIATQAVLMLRLTRPGARIDVDDDLRDEAHVVSHPT